MKITLPRAIAQLSLVAVLFALPCSIGCDGGADAPSTPAPAPATDDSMMETPDESASTPDATPTE